MQVLGGVAFSYVEEMSTEMGSKAVTHRNGARDLKAPCRGSEAGSYLRLIDFVCQSTLDLRVIQKRRRHLVGRRRAIDRSRIRA